NVVSMIRGDDLRSNLPWVCLLGIAIVTVCDLIGRTIIMPFEVPVSLILGIVGAVVCHAPHLRQRRHGCAHPHPFRDAPPRRGAGAHGSARRPAPGDGRRGAREPRHQHRPRRPGRGPRGHRCAPPHPQQLRGLPRRPRAPPLSPDARPTDRAGRRVRRRVARARTPDDGRPPRPRAWRRYRLMPALLIVLAAVFAAGLLAIDNPMPVGSRGFWLIAEMRVTSLVVMAVVAFCQAVATITFMTVTNNRIITPSIMGFE